MFERQEDEEDAQLGELSFALKPSSALQYITQAIDGLHWELARRTELRLFDHIALDYVMTAGVPIGPGNLSNRLGITTGSGTELIDRLVRSGHLERHPHPSDGRRIIVRPPRPPRTESVRTELP